jgi:hypothetical protein
MFNQNVKIWAQREPRILKEAYFFFRQRAMAADPRIDYFLPKEEFFQENSTGGCMLISLVY